MNTLNESIKLHNKNPQIISVYNQKGGVGKTTTAFHLGVGLMRQGKKVLFVDTDIQGNLTQNCGFMENKILKKGLAHLLQNVLNNIDEESDELVPLEPKEALAQTIELEGELKGISLIPMGSGKKMETIIKYISVGAESNEEFFLKVALQSIVNQFDVVIIDCPSSYGLITINALVCADYILVPMKPEFFSGKGIEGLIGIWNNIRKGFNSELKIGGILITMFEGQFKAHQEILREIKEECENKIMIFNSVIPKSSKVSEKQAQASHILDEKRNRVAVCYNKFVSEVINILGEGGCKDAEEQEIQL